MNMREQFQKAIEDRYTYDEIKEGIIGAGINPKYLETTIKEKYGKFPEGRIR